MAYMVQPPTEGSAPSLESVMKPKTPGQKAPTTKYTGNLKGSFTLPKATGTVKTKPSK